MTAKGLYGLIDSLSCDIEFDFRGNHGSVCPFSRTDISISYAGNEKAHISIENAMNDRIYDGKCLNEIAEELEIY